MSAKKPEWSRALARRIGLPGEMQFAENTIRPGLTMHVACEQGNHLVDVKIRAHDRPDQVVKRMLQAGWTIGSKPVCPEHGRKKKVSSNDKGNHDVNTTAPVEALSVSASDKARAARREALEWLSESFDTATGTYKAGVSDASIAHETGIAVKAVADLRAEFYGPLREPSEVADLRAILAEIMAKGNSLQTEIAALHRRAADASERIASLVRKNGWAG